MFTIKYSYKPDTNINQYVEYIDLVVKNASILSRKSNKFSPLDYWLTEVLSDLVSGPIFSYLYEDV